MSAEVQTPELTQILKGWPWEGGGRPWEGGRRGERGPTGGRRAGAADP